MSAPRVSLEPLIEAVGGMGELVRMCDTGNAYRARREGLSELQADRWATRCGLHAYEVWPELLDAAVAEVERECGWCGDRFVPKRHDQRGCTPRCSDGLRQRRRRQRPDVQAQNRERSRRYYTETADYARRKRRERYAANPEPERERARRQVRNRSKADLS